MNSGFVAKIPIKDADGNLVGHREILTLAGLLQRAHVDQLRRVVTKALQIPHADNGDLAVVSALVVTSRGRFTGLGDASRRNTPPEICEALVRVAESRSLCRALRWAVNHGSVAFEELTQLVEIRDATTSVVGDGPLAPLVRQAVAGVVARASRFAPEDLIVPEAAAKSEPFVAMTEAQRKLLTRLLGEKGIDSDGVEAGLCELGCVTSSSRISKIAASALIGQLCREAAPTLD